jgi:membrane protease YdiL (CAAX protease family)
LHDVLSVPGDDGVATRLRGFGPVGILAILVILSGNLVLAPLSAVLVLAWVHRSRTPWRDIGYVRPRSWIGDAILGIVFGAALKLVMKAVVMPLLGADPINQAYHYLVGNTAALPGMIFAVTVGAGWGEETVFRGYLFERLGRLFGYGRGAKAAIVLLTATLFGLAHHFEQGLPGVQQGMIVGLAFGTIYAMRGRLWMLMWAHAAFDLTALAIIYWDLETDVARLIFN